MPCLTGTDAAVAIRSLAPSLPVIVSSGYFSEKEHVVLSRLPLTTLLEKPYALRDLRAALLPNMVPNVLDGRATRGWRSSGAL